MANEVYFPLVEWLEVEEWPIASLLPDDLDSILIGPPQPAANDGVTIPLALLAPVEFDIPGVDDVALALGAPGLIEFAITLERTPFAVRFSVPVVLRIESDVLRPVKRNAAGKWEVDPDNKTLQITLGVIQLSIDGEGNVQFEIPQGVTVVPAVIGSTGIVISATDVRWLTPAAAAPHASMPNGFSGLYIAAAALDLPGLEAPPNASTIELKHVFIGTGGVTGHAALQLAATWNGSDFVGPAAFDLFGFDGCLTRIAIEVRQSALTECVIEGANYAPYIERVIGVSIGFDGAGGLTAIAEAPGAAIVGLTKDAGPATPGYILSADIEDVFKFDVSRIEFHAGGGKPASLSLSGRVKLVIASFELPAVEFKGLSIDTKGHVAIEGGWLDVAQAKSGPLSGFRLQITRIGFGVEKDGRAWVGLNGAVKLHEALPAGVSVEGLKVSWKEGERVNFSLEGIGVELAVQGVFSFVGRAAFFQTNIATGFRGSLKLSLDSVGLTIDVGIMVGRMTDGTFFFYLFIDVDLPVGIPLFSTGAALYGFAGLLAVNLQPARIDAEH